MTSDTPAAADAALLTASATELAARIRRREVSARAVVDAHIRRVLQVNERLNAVVVTRFEAARADADEADRRIGAGEPDLPPLLGVPCTIKENFAFTGMPQASGLVARRDLRAPADAPTVARLRAAGAIPLGTTNTSELCMWMESSNRVYGRTSNPYDATRIVGGSSGGEGAIIGAGASPFGLGADVGGSIRMPAFFNGVFGHKPTPGIVPNTGQVPMPVGDVARYCVTGPLARRASDLWPLLKLLAGPDDGDPASRPMALQDPASVDLATVRVLDIAGNGRQRVSADLRRVQQRCLEALHGQVGERSSAQLADLRHSFEVWAAMLAAAGGPSFSEQLGTTGSGTLLREFGRWLLRRSDHTLPALSLAAAERVPLPRRYLAVGERLREQLYRRLEGDTVALYPSYTMPAPRHHRPLLRPFDWVYTAILNVMEVPVTQVPLGLNRQGLPLGVQVVAAPGKDHLTLAVAQQLEALFGGWVPPWDAGGSVPAQAVRA